MAENSWFTRYLFRYPSDGLWIYGFLNVPLSGGPAGAPPYPVIIALHGYIDPAIYTTLDYTTGYADALARAGYIVFHPNLRGYAPSDEGDNLFRVGMAIDVLNLIGLIQASGDAFPPLAESTPERMGLWGHSMGGGISTRVITVSDRVQAALLYAPMSGDERQNYEAINRWSDGLRGLDELAVPLEFLGKISPMYFFGRITAAVSIHHGRADELVPFAWSVQTCAALTELGKVVECVWYEGMPHTFYGEGDALFVQNTITFFNRALKGD
jgi:dipeptidyl aminopeptidase/acylaminoacyl peptidase